MELEGLKACLNELFKKLKIKCSTFISDRHVQVRKYMREMYGGNRKDLKQPFIKHCFDIWHVAKGKSPMF